MVDRAVTVRQVVEEDIDCLLELRSRFFLDQFAKGQREKSSDHSGWLRDSTPKLIRNKRATLFLIQSSDRVVGYCYGLTRVTPNMQSPVISSVEEFFVEPESRGMDAGKLLFNETKADFVARGADRIQLRVLHQNEQGQSFWASVGFEPYLIIYELGS